jgi:hypothetical protein
MTIISSQRFLNYDIVEEKATELEGATVVLLPVYEVEMEDGEGNALYILADGHHRREAANDLGIAVEYEIVRHQDDLTGEQLLENSWIDSDWYYVESGRPVSWAW